MTSRLELTHVSGHSSGEFMHDLYTSLLRQTRVALCIRRTLCRHVTIGTPMVIFAVWMFLTIGTLLVQYCNVARVSCNVTGNTCNITRLYQSNPIQCDVTGAGSPLCPHLKWHYIKQCTNSVPIVKNSQKQSNSKKWPLVYQLSHVYTESAEYTKSASASAVPVRVRVRVRRIHKAVRKIPTVFDGKDLWSNRAKE